MFNLRFLAWALEAFSFFSVRGTQVDIRVTLNEGREINLLVLE